MVEKKGSLNRKSMILEAIFRDKGFSVPEEMIDLLLNLVPEKRADILIHLTAYLYPKRNSIEATQFHSTQEPIELIFVNAKDGKPVES